MFTGDEQDVLFLKWEPNMMFPMTDLIRTGSIIIKCNETEKRKEAYVVGRKK